MLEAEALVTLLIEEGPDISLTRTMTDEHGTYVESKPLRSWLFEMLTKDADFRLDGFALDRHGGVSRLHPETNKVSQVYYRGP